MSHKLVSLYIGDGEYYARTDVDNVIAEKDKEIQRLEKLCENYRCDCDNLAIMTDKMRKAGRTLREKMTHQKYRRCLAMAKRCEERCYYLNCLENYQMTDKEYKQVIGDYWDRWRKRWSELAEQFKEAK